MPLITKAAVILVVTVMATLLSPLTLAVSVWIAGPGGPIVGVAIVVGSAAVAWRAAASMRASH